MFNEIAAVYDLVKAHRNYNGEAAALLRIKDKYCQNAKTILEFACGTGNLLRRFRSYSRVGVDTSPQMLAIAKRNVPSALLYNDDMTSANLEQLFDIVLCMDGAIGYISPDQLAATVQNFVAHTRDGGMLVIEPWYERRTWQANSVHVVHNTHHDVHVVRMSHGMPNGAIEFHTLVGNSDGIKHIVEKCRFWLHDVDDIIGLLVAAGMTNIVRHGPDKIFSRGLIVAKKPS
jgi:SAM-dependent methyltransferase